MSGYFLARLDRFGMNKIFFMTLFFIKRSRLVSPDFKWSGLDIFVRFSNGKNKMAATIRNPDRTFLTASLDRFGIKNILFKTLFFTKRSRLVDHSKSGRKSPVFEWLKQNGRLSLDRFGMNKIFFMTLISKTV